MVLRSVFYGSVVPFLWSVVFPFRLPFSILFFRIAYTVYSNYIEKIGLGLKFSIDGSAKTERIRKTYGCISVCVPFFLRTHWLEWSHWTWFADKDRTWSIFKRNRKNGKTETEGIRRHFSIFCGPIEVNGSVYCQYTELKKRSVYGLQNTVVCMRP